MLEQLMLPVRAAVSGGLVLAIAELGQFQQPVFALVAAIIVTDLSASRTWELGLQRLAGTALGCVVGASLSYLVPAGPIAVALGILIAMFLCQLLRLQAATRVCGYVCGIILLNFQDQPWFYALSRSMETIVGICVAMLVSRIPRIIKPRSHEP